MIATGLVLWILQICLYPRRNKATATITSERLLQIAHLGGEKSCIGETDEYTMLYPCIVDE